MYRKELKKGAHAFAGGHVLDEGWAVYRNDPEETDGHDELVAVVDTEAIADTLIVGLEAREQPPGDEVRLHVHKIVLIAEITATSREDAVVQLDAFRESVQPAENHGITFYQPLSDEDRINLITENEGGNEDVVLATFDVAKAKDQYLKSIKDGMKSTQPTEVRDDRMDEDGVRRGDIAGEPAVFIDGDWYELTDSYGDQVVQWFQVKLE